MGKQVEPYARLFVWASVVLFTLTAFLLVAKYPLRSCLLALGAATACGLLSQAPRLQSLRLTWVSLSVIMQETDKPAGKRRKQGNSGAGDTSASD